jgi:glycosyltransferase involved in cell wall biosynthesis
MNILLVTPFELAANGGVSSTVRLLGCEFAKGDDVSVLLPGESNRVVPLEQFNGIPVFSVYLRSPRVQRGCLLRGFLSFILFFPLTLLEVRRFLNQQRIDVVLIQYPLPWVVYFAILRWFASWKLVVGYQGNDAHDLALWSLWEKNCIRFLIASSDTIVAVSQSLLNELTVTVPVIRRKKRFVIPNGAPVDLISQLNCSTIRTELPSQYLVTVGQLVHRKGIDVLVRALKIAFDSGQVMNLVVVGDGPERESLTNLTSALGLSQNVYFVGARSQEVALRLIKECCFFVLASRAEGLPLVIAEAMACGKAVVATNVDGVPEIVENGRTGLLVESENEQALAEALISLYQQSGLRKMFGGEGKARAEESFAWVAIARRYRELFDALRNQNPARHTARNRLRLWR